MSALRPSAASPAGADLLTALGSAHSSGVEEQLLRVQVAAYPAQLAEIFRDLRESWHSQGNKGPIFLRLHAFCTAHPQAGTHPSDAQGMGLQRPLTLPAAAQCSAQSHPQGCMRQCRREDRALGGMRWSMCTRACQLDLAVPGRPPHGSLHTDQAVQQRCDPVPGCVCRLQDSPLAAASAVLSSPHSCAQVDIYAALAGTRESFQEYIRTNLAAAAQSQRRQAIAIAKRCAAPLQAARR